MQTLIPSEWTAPQPIGNDRHNPPINAVSRSHWISPRSEILHFHRNLGPRPADRHRPDPSVISPEANPPPTLLHDECSGEGTPVPGRDICCRRPNQTRTRTPVRGYDEGHQPVRRLLLCRFPPGGGKQLAAYAHASTGNHEGGKHARNVPVQSGEGRTCLQRSAGGHRGCNRRYSTDRCCVSASRGTI